MMKKHINIISEHIYIIKKYIRMMKKHINIISEYVHIIKKHLRMMKKHINIISEHVHIIKKHLRMMKKHLRMMKKHLWMLFFIFRRLVLLLVFLFFSRFSKKLLQLTMFVFISIYINTCLIACVGIVI